VKKELLVVYNLCGLKNLNTEMWFKNIDDLLKQEGDFFDIWYLKGRFDKLKIKSEIEERESNMCK